MRTKAGRGRLAILAAVSATCAAFALALAGCGTTQVVVPEGAAGAGITVTSTSEVKVVPDRASIDVAVTTQGSTAAGVQEENAKTVDAVTDALRGLGVADKSIQTTGTYLSPRYDYPEEPAYDEDVIDAEGTSGIAGYEMTTSLEVSDLAIDQVGAVLQACTAAGANNANGIRYYSSEYDAKYAEALGAAMSGAFAKAQVLAANGGVAVGDVIGMTEGYQNRAYSYANANGLMATAEFADDAGGMKAMPGELSIEASVTVTYAIK